MKSNALSDKKVIYLDYDGVLHHADVMVYPNKPFQPFMCPKAAEKGHRLFEYAPTLASLIPDDVYIILSTSWANQRGHSTQWAAKWLPEKLREKVLGRTGDVWMGKQAFRSSPRGHQVLRHVAQFKPQRYVALDDDNTGFFLGSHYVQTDPVKGIMPHITRLKLIFEEWSE